VVGDVGVDVPRRADVASFFCFTLVSTALSYRPDMVAVMPDTVLLSGLNDRQRDAVTTEATPLAILAGAGSGKTRVLTRRIAWQAANGHIDASHTLAVTFTRKAAGELSDRLRALGVASQVTAGTFHALALAQLRRRWTDRGEPVPSLLERKARLLVPMLGRGPDVLSRAADLAGEIEWAKARLVTPDGYEGAATLSGRSAPLPPQEVAACYERYEADKARKGLIDFDDLIWRLGAALESDADFAAATRWRFRHFFVDEFQDVNPAQFRLLRAWLGSAHELCVVGDDDQAVYGFTGADASYLVGFAVHFPGAAVVRLEENYRSSPQILAAANAVLPGGLRTKKYLRATLADGPLPKVVAYASEVDEARGVARALQDGHAPGVAWSSMAVLYRTNAQSAPFEAALRAAGIPFRVRGAARFLERPDTVAALEELRRQAQAAPGLAFAGLLAGLAEWASGEPEERRDHAEAVIRLGHDYLAGDGGEGSLEGFLVHLVATLADDDPVAHRDAVELLTFHKAKGLEWPTVFVTGLERGLVPIAYAETPAALAEERRLLYVAITRAERNLRLSWARRRSVGARNLTRQPSAYLSVVTAALDALAPGGDGDWQTAVAAERARQAKARAAAGGAREPKAKVTVGANADPKVMAELVEWRRTLARASGVPAYVIFHDTTLAAVAEARPRNRDDLLALPGLGPVKVERYGEALLALVERHAS
jgi:DNA helicase-2/ATP-dependent DNA helicase PcrA